MKRIAILAAACLAMSACASTGGDAGPGPAPDPAPTCDANALKYLEGQRIGEIDTATLPQPLRVIPHGTAVTMEYRAGRYNLELDDEDRVVRIFCG